RAAGARRTRRPHVHAAARGRHRPARGRPRTGGPHRPEGPAGWGIGEPDARGPTRPVPVRRATPATPPDNGGREPMRDDGEPGARVRARPPPHHAGGGVSGEDWATLGGVFLGGALPWLEAIIVIPVGILAGAPAVWVVLAAVVGNLLT